MSDGTNRDAGCRVICWLVALVLGGASAWALLRDFGLDLPRAAAIGAFVMVVAAVSLRRLFCRAGRNRVARRIAEAQARTDRGAQTIRSAAALSETDIGTTEAALDARLVDEAARIADFVNTDEGDGQRPDRQPAAVVPGPGAVHGASAAGETVPENTPDRQDIEEKLAEIADNIKAEMDDSPAPVQHLADVIEGANDAGDSGADAVKDDASQPETSAATDKPPARTDAIVPARPRPATPPAEGGQRDVLTRIDGLTAAHEAALHEAGIFSFDQISRMNKRELAWINENIIGTGSARAELWRKIAIGFLRNRQERADGGDRQARAGGAKS